MMIEAYRLVRREFAATAFSGEGARLYGGRWNPPCLPMVYTADSIALATLELLVHLPALPLHKYCCIKVEMPSRLVEFVERQALPARWNRYAQPRATQLLGKAWLDEQRTVALAVPSAVVMDQWNYLLNPLHPRFAELKFSTPQAYRFDRRLFE